MNEPRLTISGNVVFDAEERVAASGQPFAVFRIANNISRRRDDGRPAPVGRCVRARR